MADLIEKLALALDIEYSELFKIEHLYEREYLLDKINRFLQKSSDEDLKIFYKFISSLKE